MTKKAGTKSVRDKKVKAMIGTVRKISLEGGIYALITDEGNQIELIDCPAELKKSGVRAEVELDQKGVDVSIGMLNGAAKVKSFKLL